MNKRQIQTITYLVISAIALGWIVMSTSYAGHVNLTEQAGEEDRMTLEDKRSFWRQTFAACIAGHDLNTCSKLADGAVKRYEERWSQ